LGSCISIVGKNKKAISRKHLGREGFLYFNSG
jgi:hypothetical protein